MQSDIKEFRSNLFKREYFPKVRAFPRVRKLFERIHANDCKLVLASSCAADEIDQYKAIAGISVMTDCDVTADDAPSSKPAPDIFLKALDQIAPIQAFESCVVGDTKYDGEAARRAGIPFVGLLCGGSSKQVLERSGAIAVYRDPADFLTHWDGCLDLLVKREPEAAHRQVRALTSHAASMPHLVQILLPLYDNVGKRFPTAHYDKVRGMLTEAFGGLTAYSRAPAEGLWDSAGRVKRDDIIIIEVMTDSLDRAWWRDYRCQLERLFRQDQIVLRAQAYETL